MRMIYETMKAMMGCMLWYHGDGHCRHQILMQKQATIRTSGILTGPGAPDSRIYAKALGFPKSLLHSVSSSGRARPCAPLYTGLG